MSGRTGRRREGGWIALLALLGLGRMIADLAGVDGLAAALGATGAAPAPKVFSSVRGLETFSSRFQIEWTDEWGRVHGVALDPALGSRIRGPYNRRNVYGAAIAYGPVLLADARTRPLFESVARFGLCGGAPLLAELGLETPGRIGPARIRVHPERATAPSGLPLLLEADCS